MIIIPDFSNITDLYKPTDQCFLWCKEQHIIHSNNLTVQAMILPAIAAICLVAARTILILHKRIILTTDITEESLTKFYKGLHDFAILLLIGFFIWFKWFRQDI